MGFLKLSFGPTQRRYTKFIDKSLGSLSKELVPSSDQITTDPPNKGKSNNGSEKYSTTIVYIKKDLH